MADAAEPTVAPGSPGGTASLAAADGMAWPDDRFDLAGARAWIRPVLPGTPAVTGPTRVYQAKGWGATAAFAVAPPVGAATPGDGGQYGRDGQDGEESPSAAGPRGATAVRRRHAPASQVADRDTAADGVGSEVVVVLKVAALPRFAYAPRLYALLGRAAPGRVPALLAWDERTGGQTRMLFRPFAGETIERRRDPAALVALARTVAAIQGAVAALPAGALAATGTPSVLPTDLPAMLDAVLDEATSKHRATWAEDDGALGRRFGVPDDLIPRLAARRSQAVAWADELAAAGGPETVDHVDLHAGNAVVGPDGTTLVYDWEEATRGCGLLSLDRLLVDAWALDARALGATEGAGRATTAADDDLPEAFNHPEANGRPLGATERAVRDAYLDALPAAWGPAAARRRACDLALALAPIKAAHEGLRYAEALGWSRGIPPLAAFCLVRALRRLGGTRALTRPPIGPRTGQSEADPRVPPCAEGGTGRAKEGRDHPAASAAIAAVRGSGTARDGAPVAGVTLGRVFKPIRVGSGARRAAPLRPSGGPRVAVGDRLRTTGEGGATFEDTP
ncbi:MAG: hypothetical protein AVDCRST_MAG49-4643 [uncultured Thermomicrobiales bacterium]|uniref:Uncharacterized protein n=1 Tax=uncultured Thermomicrobiales bacterium TaxID=1645740 RepID=A0A6J4VK39_9BACT|nr:MAG: hypothetical protein AVDCRST_MAG49-4643 [uncultured Thermomicrobiales bacterium]